MPEHIDDLGPFQEFIEKGLQRALVRLDNSNSDIQITENGIYYRLGRWSDWKNTELICLVPPDIISYYITCNLGDEIGDAFDRVKLVQITDDDMAFFVDDRFCYSVPLKW